MARTKKTARKISGPKRQSKKRKSTRTAHSKKKKKKEKSSRARTAHPSKRREPLDTIKKRARGILRRLRKLYPDADCALEHGSAFEILIATILSAQSTDVNVNKVTPILFREYPTPADLAAAPPERVEQIIKSTGFFRQKRKSIQGAAARIMDEFEGEVPDHMEGLTSLPGVARKTANVVLGTWFGKNEGIVVDTHIGRLSHRLGLTWSSKDSKDAVRIEADLMQVVPRKSWTYFGHALIGHGRVICSARRPKCEACALAPQCPSAFQITPG